jgi:hypothetical protein
MLRNVALTFFGAFFGIAFSAAAMTNTTLAARGIFAIGMAGMTALLVVAIAIYLRGRARVGCIIFAVAGIWVAWYLVDGWIVEERSPFAISRHTSENVASASARTPFVIKRDGYLHKVNEAVFLHIKNTQSEAVIVRALEVDALADDGLWIPLTRVKTGDSELLMSREQDGENGLKNAALVSYKDLMEGITNHYIRSGDVASGWLFLAYPEDLGHINEGHRIRITVIGDNNSKYTKETGLGAATIRLNVRETSIVDSYEQLKVIEKRDLRTIPWKSK